MTSSFAHIDHEPGPGGNILDIDAKLIADLQGKNDRAAFTQLMNKYKRTVFGFCFRYTGNIEDAQDLSQDVFIKVFKNIKSFKGRSKFSTWLYRITMNCCHDHSSRVKNQRTRETVSFGMEDRTGEAKQPEIKDTSADPEKIMLNKELGVEIRNAVVRLNARQRAVLILKDFQGKSYDEISTIMNMNQGTVKSTLSRGRLNVAKQIKEYYKK